MVIRHIKDCLSVPKEEPHENDTSHRLDCRRHLKTGKSKEDDMADKTGSGNLIQGGYKFTRERTARERIEDWGGEDVVIFENPSYDEAFLGVSDDNRAVYSYDRMVECLVKEDGMDYEEAADFVSYNSIRACQYTEGAPIVLYEME
jgi:hypothetical protein